MAAKRKVLSIVEKAELIREVEKHSSVSLRVIAAKLDVPTSTLGKIKQKKEEILNAAAKAGKHVKKMRLSS